MAKGNDMEIHYRDKPIKCPVCGHTRFITQKAFIKPRLIDILKLP